DELAIDFDFRGQRLEQLLLGHVHLRRVLRRSERNTVEADLNFGDVGDAVLVAVLELGLGHGARGAGDVGMLRPDAAAEDLHAAAGSGRFDDRRTLAGLLRVFFSSSLRERKYGRRSDNADLIAGLS